VTAVAAERVGGQAVVLGGSLAGLLSARVLAEHYDRVLVVDRDELSGVGTTRRGVPHGGHAHGLIARGHEILEQHFPGLTDELGAAGVVPGDFGENVRWYFGGRRIATTKTGLISVPATRPVLEYHVRLRVQQLPNVEFLERHDILGLTADPGGHRITGARVRSGDEERELAGDLVVDTTGRGSRTPAWLAGLGYPRPAEDKVKVGLAYTTRHFRLNHDPFGTDIALIPVATPEHPRGGLLYKLPGHDDRVELSLTGVLGDHPPTSSDGFLEFARSLPTPEIYDAVKDAEPLDDAVCFVFPASVRRRYERLDRFPAGLLVLGDAVCSFNPVYGQGMTVAAMESLTLRKHVRANGGADPKAFFADVARDADGPWEFSAGADLGYPGVPGRRSAQVRFANAYVNRLQRAAVHDPSLTEAFIRVAGLIDPPQALMKPGRLLRVLKHGGSANRPPLAPKPVAVQPKTATASRPTPAADPSRS
jgi:2-polyprenyl-6-methoxyphenol hydroxylase-like FAD-dependent oxidoreductase